MVGTVNSDKDERESVNVAIVDTGGANLNSVLFALRRLDVNIEPTFTRDPRIIAEAQRVILPGVGAAADAMSQLREAGLVELIPTLTQPVLGICLGMQLLFARSDEGGADTLKIMLGNVVRMNAASKAGLPVPHMGWNTLHFERDSGDPLFEGIEDGAHMYFVHSFRAPLRAPAIACTHYGETFAAAVRWGNFMGVQFHPERSGTLGARILKNFCTGDAAQWK